MMALSNSYWRSDCNLMVLFLIRSNEDLSYIILLDNFVVFTFDSTNSKTTFPGLTLYLFTRFIRNPEPTVSSVIVEQSIFKNSNKSLCFE